jgi:hypothetical protein
MYKSHWSQQGQDFRNFVPYQIPDDQVVRCPHTANIWTCEKVKLAALFMDQVAVGAFKALGCTNKK